MTTLPRTLPDRITPGADACRWAADAFPAGHPVGVQRWSPLRRLLGPVPDYFVSVGPGVVRVGRSTTPGWELHDTREADRLRKSLTTAARDLVDALEHYGGDFGSLPLGLLADMDPDAVVEAFDDWMLNARSVFDARRCRLDDARTDLGLLLRARPKRGVVKLWSRKSRARLVRTAALLDWSPLNRPGLCVPALVTLTYPGDWLSVCPDGETAKRHLRAFRSAFDRRFPAIGAAGMWKLEFQRRGAPHYHLILAVPLGDRREFREWVAKTWARIVGSAGVDRARHEVAGVAVDYSEGARMCDPRRVAVYFAKHAAPHQSSKEYQHLPPAEWLVPADGLHGPWTSEHLPPRSGSIGRWWGVWSLDRVDERTVLDRHDAVEVRRLLRSWKRAESRRYVADPHQGGTRPRRVDFVPRSFGQSEPAGFIVVNDGPALARRLSDALFDPPDWPPGQRRPLP